MILLTEDEIWDVDSWKESHGIPPMETRLENVAKVQLKKVVGWGNKTCKQHPEVNYPESGTPGTHYNKRHNCPLCWQALNEEVK